MYKMKMVCGHEEIIKFEKMRCDVFQGKKDVQHKKECSFYEAIDSGDMIALECLEDDQIVGGVLLGEENRTLLIVRLFTSKEKRSQGVGAFLLDYISNHQSYFEDYYGTELKGIVAEPLARAIDFYLDNGYDYSGTKMYKKYPKKVKKKYDDYL